MNDNPLRKIRKVSLAILVVALGITNTSVLAQPSAGGEDSSTALAKKTQNPISDLISVPFQNSDDRWTVPIGGGVQKILHLGKLPLNTQLQAYWNVETPDGGADWQLRFQFAFLFPK